MRDDDPGYEAHEYLGDGVYAKVGNMGTIWLTTGAHADRAADNRIAMEPEVTLAFLRYIKNRQPRIMEALK